MNVDVMRYQISLPLLVVLFSFFFRCCAVFDTSAALDVSVIESVRELRTRMHTHSDLPVLSGECPGWVCYAEKSTTAAILSRISRVKSPQAITGYLLKNYFLREHMQLNPRNTMRAT